MNQVPCQSQTANKVKMSRDTLILTGYLFAYAVIHTTRSTDYLRTHFPRILPLYFVSTDLATQYSVS